MPVHIRAYAPLLQVQPVPQVAYSDEVLAAFGCIEAADLEPAYWDRLGHVLLPHPDREARQGNYAVTVRKRRLCPVDHTALFGDKTG